MNDSIDDFNFAASELLAYKVVVEEGRRAGESRNILRTSLTVSVYMSHERLRCTQAWEILGAFLAVTGALRAIDITHHASCITIRGLSPY